MPYRLGITFVNIHEDTVLPPERCEFPRNNITTMEHDRNLCYLANLI